jgi:hypothetical protein
MDPVEEFSFKPINEGLGFHRKKVELKEQMKAAKVVQDAIGKVVPPKPKADIPVLKSPLPRKETQAPLPQAGKPSKDVIDELVRSFKKPADDFIESPSPTFETVLEPKITPMSDHGDPLPWMMSPFFIDAMLVVALTLSCLLITLVVTKADLLLLMTAANTNISFWLTFPAIIMGMSFSYMSLSRLFLGASLGELVFDLQLGSEEDQQLAHYGFQAAFRSFLAIITGFALLPILSMLFGRDFLGTLSGLGIYHRSR